MEPLLSEFAGELPKASRIEVLSCLNSGLNGVNVDCAATSLCRTFGVGALLLSICNTILKCRHSTRGRKCINVRKEINQVYIATELQSLIASSHRNNCNANVIHSISALQ
ncbi:hypothetical protein RB195_021755 [Necator americanus]|uniref:Uncharacterized protein n=1 Tax=Necator americanus TaxID=51031 RepID=A0ABR1ECT9_NECAM